MMETYARKVLPMFKRAAIIMEVCEPSARDQARGIKGNEPEAMMLARVLAARKSPEVPEFLSSDCETLLRLAISEMRADRDKAVAVARTVARLGGDVRICQHHIAEALQYQHSHLANWTDSFEEAQV